MTVLIRCAYGTEIRSRGAARVWDTQRVVRDGTARRPESVHDKDVGSNGKGSDGHGGDVTLTDD